MKKSNLEILKKNKKYLIAISGGVDSMSLLHFLYNCGYDLFIVHINHNTREKENILEENLIKKVANKYNYEYKIASFSYENGNFQGESRNFRDQIYMKLVQEKNLEGVILAHHLDDQVENILMYKDKLGQKQMEEIKYINGLKKIRPLLGVFKEEIYLYAKKNNVDYYEDSSNSEDKYLRNKVRLEIKNMDKRVKEDLIKKDLEVAKRIDFLAKDEYLKSDEKELLIYYLLKSKIKKNVSKNLIEEIMRVYTINGSRAVLLPEDKKLIIEYGNIYLKEENKYKKEQELIIGINEFNGIKFSNEIEKGKIRIAEEDDKIVLKNGSKKINRVFIDQKIPREKREYWPVVINDKNEIIYIPIEEKK